MSRILTVALLFIAAGCNNISASKDDSQSLIARENAVDKTQKEHPGELIAEIDYQVRTKNLKVYEDGIMNWISIEHPEKEVNDLIGRDSIVIPRGKVTIIIDYPLSAPYKFDVVSGTGFTKGQLIERISSEYHKIYEEEEATAKIKTLPMKQRKMYNRNQTDGKYGIWGHDLGDLLLDDILVYRAKDGQLILTLEIDS